MSNQELYDQDLKTMEVMQATLKVDLLNILEMDNSIMSLAGTTRPQLRKAALAKYVRFVSEYADKK